jgi:ribose transport system substrate-binding protein
MLLNAVNSMKGKDMKRTVPMVTTGALVLMLLSACSTSGPATSTATGTPDAACNLAAVTAKIDAAKKVPAWVAPGPAIDAAKLRRGSVVYTISENSANEFGQAQLAGIKEAADKVGLKIVDYPNQGDKQQWIQGVNAAVNEQASAIIFIGGTIGPIYFSSQADAARKAGVKLITLIDTDVSQPAETGTDARVAQPYSDAARLDADLIIADSNCQANVLVLTANELIAGNVNQLAAEDEFKKYCGSTCKITFQNIPVANWTSQIQPTVQSAVQADPKLNYVMPLYDAMVQFTNPALTLAGAEDRVNVVSFNGTPAILGMIGKSPLIADVGENPAQLGFAAVDQTLRLLTGAGPVASGNENVTLRVFDSSNASEAGTPPALGVGYGNDWKSGYLKLWGVG